MIYGIFFQKWPNTDYTGMSHTVCHIRYVVSLATVTLLVRQSILSVSKLIVFGNTAATDRDQLDYNAR